MLRAPIIVREATAEDISFMRAMIWEAILASPTFVARYGADTLQHMERAIAFAREKSAKYIILFVDPINTPAIALYRRVGFVEIVEKDHLIEMRIYTISA